MPQFMSNDLSYAVVNGVKTFSHTALAKDYLRNEDIGVDPVTRRREYKIFPHVGLIIIQSHKTGVYGYFDLQRPFKRDEYGYINEVTYHDKEHDVFLKVTLTP